MSAFGVSHGWYSWEYAGGKFPVAIRPMNAFFCPQYAAASTWYHDGQTLKIDWANYGKYQLEQRDGIWQGSAIGKPESWRKMCFERPFSEAESLLLDSEWNFEWEKGAFNIEFRGDGFNHFVCPQYPSHSHWNFTAENNVVCIDWSQYGQYELVLDAASRTMTGHKVGQPTNWRRASFVRKLGADEAKIGLSSHDHEAHTHGPDCNH